MTVYAIDSNASAGLNDGTSWANAFTTVSAFTAATTAGDIGHAASDHIESINATIGYNWRGSISNMIRVVSVDKTSGFPATVKQRGAKIAAVSASTFTLVVSGSVEIEGFDLASGGGNIGGTARLVASNNTTLIARDLKLICGGSGVNQKWYFGQAGAGTVIYAYDIVGQFEHASQGFGHQVAWPVYIHGLSIDPTSVPIQNIWGALGTGCIVEVYGADYSNCTQSAAIHTFAGYADARCIHVGVAMPSAWDGNFIDPSQSPVQGARFELRNYAPSNSDVHYKIWIEEAAGTIKDETTVVKTSGSIHPNGNVAYSYKMTTRASAVGFAWGTLRLPPIAVQNTTIGSGKTYSVSILHDSTTNLQDDEIFSEIGIYATSASPLISFYTNQNDGVVTAADVTADSGATWTTTGLTNPNKQKLVHTVTAQEIGPVSIQVGLCKPSYTVYVDLLPVES